MGERRALVIASQCEGLNLLSFLPDTAREVSETLLDPSIGGCVPALPDTPLLVDPTVAELDSAVTEAFERASEDEATLFIALVGHGEYTYDDFYFLVRDTTLPPNSRTAFLLAQRIRELLAQHSLLDGLVLLLDTCHAGIAAQQVGSRWIQIVGQAGRRFEVLTASDERTAANGCFSRQLVNVLRSGHPELGSRLRCPDMKAVLSGLCPAQTAVHLAFDGRREIAAGDEGLWLAKNTSEAWRSSLAADNPAADLIDSLTRDYVAPEELRTVVGHLMMGMVTVAVVGPGLDKSRLVAALARPSVAPDVIPPRLMDAVVFVSATDTAERTAAELARQLGKNVRGFAEAARAFEASTDPAVWQAADAFERAVAGPLRESKLKVRIAVDGVDNLPAATRNRLVHALQTLQNAQTVLAVKDMITAQARVWLGKPTGPVIQPGGAGAPGGSKSWAGERQPDDDLDIPPFPIRENPTESPPDLTDLLNACGKARVPTSVLVAASELPVSAVRDFLVRQEHVTRLEPGTSRETVATIDSPLLGSARAHSAIADAVLRLAPPEDRASGSPEQTYADAMLAEHLWQAGRDTELVECLDQRGSSVPAENHATWELWSNRIGNAKGSHVRPAIVARARYFTSMVKIGDITGALRSFQELLPVAEHSLPADDPEIYIIRNNIGYLLFELGRADESQRQLQSVVADATRHIGQEHEETLRARHLLAVATGQINQPFDVFREQPPHRRTHGRAEG
ncbi:caspase family protein [Kibdelosporangium aridum]|uniref:caspase family protein n=1 Tax=Kibdelosporangium aridum TaxID=2030 RepID=UPI000AEA0FD1